MLNNVWRFRLKVGTSILEDTEVIKYAEENKGGDDKETDDQNDQNLVTLEVFITSMMGENDAKTCYGIEDVGRNHIC